MKPTARSVARPPGGSSAASSVGLLESFLSLLPPDAAPGDIKDLRLASKKIKELPRQTLFLSHLLRLDLSNNELASAAPIANMVSLTFLNLAHNQLESVSELKALKRLQVLNISCNRVQSLRGVEGSAGSSLKALIANDNRIRLEWCELSGTTPKPQSDKKASLDSNRANLSIAQDNFVLLNMLSVCETIVLSRNPELLLMSAPEPQPEDKKDTGATIADEGQPSHHPLDALAELKALKKLSLTDCGIASLPARWFLPNVTEVRLAKNKLQQVPSGVIFKSCQILDVSHNLLTSLGDLRRAKFLQQLHVAGNPCMTEFSEGHHSLGNAASSAQASGRKKGSWPPSLVLLLSRMFPSLRNVDGQAFAVPTADERKALLVERRTQAAEDGHNNNGVVDDDCAEPPRQASRKEESASDTVHKKKAEVAVLDEELPDTVYDIPVAVVEQQRAAPKPVVRRHIQHGGSGSSHQSAASGVIAAGRGASVLDKVKSFQETSGW